MSAVASTSNILCDLTEFECACVIENLISKPFSARTYEEKKDIIEKGRSTPLRNLTKKSKNAVRHFHDSWYSDLQWLCGCSKMNKLYCWPCLLFSSETNAWNKEGLQNLDSFRVMKRRHEVARAHVNAVADMIQFGRSRIEFSLSTAYRKKVDKYNENVKNNRYIVSTLIDAVCFLSKQELPFRGHRETQECDNRGT